MTDEPGTSLTRREFDAVIRRAAELSSADGAGDGSLSEVEGFRIAGEVGLSSEHVRQALTDVRAEGLDVGVVDRIFGPLYVRAARVVPGTSWDLTAKIDEFLAGSQLLQSVRRTSELLLYRPSVDWASQIARAASFTSRKYYLASAKSVEVHVTSLENDRSRIEFVVDPGTRDESIIGTGIGGGSAGLAAGSLAGWGLAALTPVGLAVGVGVVLGTGIATGITYLAGASHKKKLGEVQMEIEGVLDTLERGESLEPPPASWRRWVKRHFHGVARDVMQDEA